MRGPLRQLIVWVLAASLLAGQGVGASALIVADGMPPGIVDAGDAPHAGHVGMMHAIDMSALVTEPMPAADNGHVCEDCQQVDHCVSCDHCGSCGHCSFFSPLVGIVVQPSRSSERLSPVIHFLSHLAPPTPRPPRERHQS